MEDLDLLTEKEKEEILLSEKWSNGNEDAYHFWFGIISKFPLCCIMYFCDVWNNGISEQFGLDMDVGVDTNVQHDKRVMCPLCIINALSKKP